MKATVPNYNSVEEAIHRAGGQTALAKMIGVKQPTIFKWLKKGVVPPRRVLLVEKVTGISRYELNPLIYPRASEELIGYQGKE